MLQELNHERMHEHVRTAGWLLIASELAGLACGGLGFLFFVSIGVVSGDAEAMPVLGAIGGFLLCLTTILSLPGLVAGIGLVQRRSWARILALIVAFFNLAWFPIGTIISAYIFWVLLQDEAQSYFYGPLSDSGVAQDPTYEATHGELPSEADLPE